MTQTLKKFFIETDGAVAIDFAVLMAAVAGLSVGVLFTILDSAPTFAEGLQSNIETSVGQLTE